MCKDCVDSVTTGMSDVGEHVRVLSCCPEFRLFRGLQVSRTRNTIAIPAPYSEAILQPGVIQKLNAA